jgi:glucan endo-1,3-alpha-glucosidase
MVNGLFPFCGARVLRYLDWGESHYIGPLHREAGIPAGAEKWITGYNHEPWQDICKYFIQAYKRGKAPDIDVSPLPRFL